MNCLKNLILNTEIRIKNSIEIATSPKEFFDKYVTWNLADKVSLIHAPTQDKPFGKAYTVKFLGTVKELEKLNT